MFVQQGGDLFDAITQSVKFSEINASKMVFDLAQALYYLHSRSVVHRDLKPENILVKCFKRLTSMIIFYSCYWWVDYDC